MLDFLRNAVLSFVWFTLCLTPYMIWVVGVDQSEYIAWLGMQLVLVPPVGGGFAWILKRMDK